MGHQVIKLQNPLKTLGFLQFYRFKTVKDRIITLLSILSSKAPFWYVLSKNFFLSPVHQNLRHFASNQGAQMAGISFRAHPI